MTRHATLDRKHESFARVVLWLSGAPFIGIGLAFLVAPSAMSAVVGLEVTSTTADRNGP